jgi:MoxR-like ATPase
MGRDYVIPDDVKALAESALAHRMIIKTSSSIHDVLPGQVVHELLETTSVGAVTAAAASARGPREVEARARASSES